MKAQRASSALFFFCFSGKARGLLNLNTKESPVAIRFSSPSFRRFLRTTTATRRMVSSASSTTTFPSVADFCKQLSSRPFPGDPPRLSIGNPAGDADSIVSAIGIAYVDTILRKRPTVPVVSIPLPDLQSLRPETRYLFSLVGMPIDQLDRSSVIAIDDPVGLPDVASVTLVDHNQLTLTDNKKWKVDEILDHHMDEGSHHDTCQKENRIVAFDKSSSAALVASTCTLVVEQWNKYGAASTCTTIPPTLSILLLGVILLDSINLSPDAGKVTERDRRAVEILQQNTEWNALALPGEVCSDGKEGGEPDYTKLFDALSKQKLRPEFWNGLTALQAVKLDYKSFTVDDSDGTSSAKFGVSSVLQSMPEFLQKPDISKSLADNYFPDVKFFIIMFMTVVDGTPQRQMMLTSLDEPLLDSLLKFLEQRDSLQVNNINRSRDDETQLFMVTMEQGNGQASRKQIAPIFMDFLRKYQNDDS